MLGWWDDVAQERGREVPIPEQVAAEYYSAQDPSKLAVESKCTHSQFFDFIDLDGVISLGEMRFYYRASLMTTTSRMSSNESTPTVTVEYHVTSLPEYKESKTSSKIHLFPSILYFIYLATVFSRLTQESIVTAYPSCLKC